MITPQILVAEDEMALRDIVIGSLHDAGFRAAAAANGREAMSLLRTYPGILLLLSDVKMPSMDGFALAEEALGLRPELKILMMTGYEQPTPSSLLLAREIRTLRKPISLGVLCDLVGEMLSRP